MVDYTPSYLNEIDTRNFFNPPLTNDDIPKAQILLYIETVEKYINEVYGLTGTTVRIPALLLIASKIIATPKLAKKHYTLSSEKLGDYEYTLAEPISRGTDIQSSPYIISKTWERMALDMLEEMSTSDKKWGQFLVVNG